MNSRSISMHTVCGNNCMQTSGLRNRIHSRGAAARSYIHLKHESVDAMHASISKKCRLDSATKSLGPRARSIRCNAVTPSDSDVDLEGFDVDGMDPRLEDFEGFRDRGDDDNRPGYTPFEFIDFTEIPLKHEVSVWVDRPVADVYKVWHNRLNWMQWFDMIEEVGFHEEEPTYISMYLWYRWAMTPYLELYVTLERTEEAENKYIIEEPVEGFPLVAAVLFQEGCPSTMVDTGSEGHASVQKDSGTTVMLRMSYLLPKVLHEFAGAVAVYGDVDKKLTYCMAKMKELVETVDLEELERVRSANEAEIKSNFAEQRQMKAEGVRRREERIQRWEEELAELAEQKAREAGGEMDEKQAEFAACTELLSDARSEMDVAESSVKEGDEEEASSAVRSSRGSSEKNPGAKGRGRRKKT